MANKTKATQEKSDKNQNQNLAQGGQPLAGAGGDVADEATLDRLEAIAGGADEDDPQLFLDPDLQREVDKFDASIDEEIDALQVDLVQDGGLSHTDDTSGRVVDEVAEEEIARFTETGPMQPDQGVVSAEPGREDTSARLRRHHPNSVARSQDVVEGNLDEPRDEEVGERKVDEGTAA
jgi:hypothetical protein